MSLSPAITETLVAIDAADPMVGRSDFCAGSAAIDRLPAVGSGLTPNLEGIVALRPSHVLVEGNKGANEGGISQIATVVSLPWLTVDDITRSTRRLGELTGREAQASALGAQLSRKLAPRDTPEAPSVLLVIGDEGPAGDIWFIKPNSLHGAALRAAGARNVIDADVSGSPSLSAERVLTLDPDRIVLLAGRALTDVERRAAVDRWRALQPLSAVKQGHVVVLDGPGLLNAGPSVLAFVDRLAPLVRHEAAPHE